MRSPHFVVCVFFKIHAFSCRGAVRQRDALLPVHCGMPGEPAENLATLWLEIKRKYKGAREAEGHSDGHQRCFGPVLHSLWTELRKARKEEDRNDEEEER